MTYILVLKINLEHSSFPVNHFITAIYNTLFESRCGVLRSGFALGDESILGTFTTIDLRSQYYRTM